MKEVSLSGSPRENVGRKDAAALRKSGHVPCVIYGDGEQVSFSAKHSDMEKLIFTPNVFQVNVEVGGTKKSTFIKEYQLHPITDKIMHVDFMTLDANKPAVLSLPVRIIGTAPGVIAGGKLQRVFRKLKVKGLPGAFPEEIEVKIGRLNIGDAVRVRDLEVEGVTFLDPASAVVVSVKMARGAKKGAEAEEEEEAEEGAEAPAEAGGEE